MPAPRPPGVRPRLALLLLPLLWLLALAGLPVASGAGTLIVDPAVEHLTPGRNVDYLADPGRQRQADEVRRLPGWRAVPADNANFGYSPSAFWFRTRLLNPADRAQERLLEISYPVLDHVDVWLQPSAGDAVHQPMGDKLPFMMRPLQHRNFLLPVTLPPQGSVDVLIRIETGSSVQVPIALWQPDAFRRQDEHSSMVMGIFLGIMFSMMLYNSFLCFSLRETQYAWYVGYVAAITLFLASLEGVSFQFLWPRATHWNDQVLVFSLALAEFFGSLFARNFLHLEQAPRFMRLSVNLTLAGSLVGVAAALLLDYTTSIHLVEGIAVLFLPIVLIFAIYSAWQGYKPARLYVMAWSCVLLSGVVLAADKYGLIPTSTLTMAALQVGSALQILLLSFALADRVQRERRLREQARLEMLHMQQEANTVLERRVKERTTELMEANLRLQELTMTDALTGVHNRRHFDEVLRQEVKRAMRTGTSMGLLIIDADHFKAVNDTWGHQTGDLCLQTIARVLQSQIHRECDTVARYGGEEFCIVLPSTPATGVWHVAEAMRKALEATPIPGPHGDFHITASIGGVGIVPEDDEDGVRMLATADAALYMAKQSGRNRVSVRCELD